MNSKTVDKIWTSILYVISFAVVALLVFLLAEILIKGFGFLNPKFLFSTTGEDVVGIQLFNSFYLLILSLTITIILGVGAGIYLAEYAKPGKFMDFVRLCIESMASLPSIVVGLFGYLIFVVYTKWSFTLFAGAITLTILNLPSVTRVAENAIRDASANIKEASLGLGATRWQTMVRLILPTAFPQILTGIILAAGRIFGEAAALIYTAGTNASRINLSASITSKANPFNIFRPAETLSVHIWKLNAEGTANNSMQIAAQSAAVLVVMVLIFNILARVLSKIIHLRYAGSK
ncbi:phosphate ABC transporter permease PstA [uncultured Clostridium sp.]|uniref:phosphate ABC transporter permease PstA n=1 Tax=uncultured Clostridium sp. TaxID=59620 RepID=UPI0025CDD350|nr:phosphate ABC transporter permease PstA [uncultured Clostridium sp.]